VRNLILFILVLLFILYNPFPQHTKAQIHINEIGIEQSPQTIELINTSSESADISHWYLDDSGGTTYYTIPDNTYLYPLSCMVFTYDLNLNKSSPDTSRLFDATAQPTSNSANLIDSYSYKSSPGNSLTYARIPDGDDNWTTSEASFGLWNSTHKNCIILPTPTPTPIPTPTALPTPTITPTNIPTPTPTTSPTSYPNTYEFIYISEVMVYPEKNNPEWIELYNNNDFPVLLYNWYIDDLENKGSSPKLFSLEIPAKQYKTYEFTSSLFNNDSDSVRLLDSNKNEKDSFEYEEAVQEKTFGRTSYDSDSFCTQEPSRDMPNNTCIELPTKLTPSKNPTPVNKSVIQPKIPNSTSYKINITLDPPLPNTNIIKTQQINILGEETHKNIDSPPPISFYQTPFYISFSYSLLTIFSVLIKIKNAF